jgi:aspartyl-tRNA(Asn)/glutamyl-tRNA(Gln) amidotransferase subunit B
LNKAWIEEIKQSMGILPDEALKLLVSKGLSKEDAEKICQQKLWFEYFVRLTEKNLLPANILAIILVNKVLPFAETSQRDATLLISDTNMAELTDMYNGGKVGKSQILSVLLPALLEQADANVWDLANQHKLIIDQNEDTLSAYIDEVLLQNPEKVKEYLKGKSGLIGFFMGQVKLKSATALDAALLKNQLEAALEKQRVKS